MYARNNALGLEIGRGSLVEFASAFRGASSPIGLPARREPLAAVAGDAVDPRPVDSPRHHGRVHRVVALEAIGNAPVADRPPPHGGAASSWTYGRRCSRLASDRPC